MKTILILSMSLLLTGSAVANPPNSGSYWNIETNMYDKSYTIVRFYNAEHELLHEKVIKGDSLDLQSSRDRRKLNRSLRVFVKLQKKAKLYPARQAAIAASSN